MSTYLITEDGRRWLLEQGDDVDDVVTFLIETRATTASSPIVALSRQQVVARIGRGIPTDFPDADVLIGDPDQGATRGWWEATVQRWLGKATEPAATITETAEPAADDEQASRDGRGAHASGTTSTSPQPTGARSSPPVRASSPLPAW
ncbi:hypothetical protein I552_0447 [Mycobacterium xenopi 3993]|nr:hypothetical protein I552_0447 [Mycobacterium xenopi 3993]